MEDRQDQTARSEGTCARPMDVQQLTTSLGELNLETVAVPSSRYDQGDQHEPASDDSWCDDDLLNEISDADLNREQKRRYDQFYTMGYRDGITAGKEASAQEGFNIGFKQSAYDGYKWGIVRGITSTFASLTDQSKEKLLKKFENRDKFQSLYESVQAISTDEALKMYYFQLLQNSTQSHEWSEGSFQVTPLADEDLDCNKLDFFFKDLMSLVSESSEIKVSVTDVIKKEEEE